jgi:phosphopantothenoylcysteine decarboxylase
MFDILLAASAEWEGWDHLGDSVLHIDLRDWADILIVSPLSAHTLAKIAHGLCDDTLSCVARAWDFGHGTRPGKPLLLAPAMNTAMWEHPLTQAHLNTVQGFWNILRDSNNGVQVVAPQVKTLACGEVGNGALASVEDIAMQVEQTLEEWRVHKK